MMVIAEHAPPIVVNLVVLISAVYIGELHSHSHCVRITGPHSAVA